ncbi:C-type lectin 37Db-like [Anopheles aquasalis]|uniref:C-type lectin 37Db-like n=1 Tax=Anopheles aquasalis TaxID=42839 RepID=UPI00215A4BF2|nr:C-type lectin 37Db-like [Anopheles aquasalis]
MATLRLLSLFAIVLSVLAQLASPQESDDNTFAVFRQKRYYFSDSFKLNWFKAMEYCRTRGMFLLSVRNPQEREAVIEYLDNTGYTKTHKGLWAWISANDLGEEGEFYWSTTGERVTYPNWSDTEPNNFKIDDCNREDCAILEYWAEGGANYNYTFNDRYCMREYHFICETLLE